MVFSIEGYAMSFQSINHMSLDKPTHAICVQGMDVCLDLHRCAMQKCRSFTVTGTLGVSAYLHLPSAILDLSNAEETTTYWLLSDSRLLVKMTSPRINIDRYRS